MGGKVSLYMVLIFSFIFLIAGFNFNSLTNRALENEVHYYAETKAHDIAVSGANIISNKIWVNNSWTGEYNDVSINGGKLNIKAESVSSNRVQVRSIGTYTSAMGFTATDTIIVILQPLSFAQFGYYMNQFPGNLFFASGDIFYGDFHTQQKLRVDGSPVFWGRASAKGGLQKVSKSATPIFNGGFESGTDISLNWDPSISKNAAQNGGRVLAGSGGKKIDVRMTFNSNASLNYQISTNGGSSWSNDTTVTLSSFAPNGVIYIDKGNLYLKGTVNGQYTLVVDQSSGSGTGNVYLEDDIVYNSTIEQITSPKPDEYPGSYKVNGNDMLGIVCSNNIEIINNAANRDNINIHAALFSYKGGLKINDVNMPRSGYINLLGSLTEEKSQITGVVDGSGNITNGYNERIYFDQRFRGAAPPYYPLTSRLTVVSWYESTWFPQ